jgi:ADP-ribosylglycohydrolase
VGDALGADVEFLSTAAIRERFGPAGVTGYPGGHGRITDDTQMTLFTAEGLIRAAHADRRSERSGEPGPTAAEVIWSSYRRWLLTQEHHYDERAVAGTGGRATGWLIGRRELWAPRAPGLTCVGALRSGRMGRVLDRINDSKGCGGVMRVAPVGLVATEPFRVAVEAAAITHTHPPGYLAAGAFATVVGALSDGADLLDAVGSALDELARWSDHEETTTALRSALDLAARHPVPDPELVETLGGGWVAEEALAIALYCALCATNVRDGLLWAVNHSGDSDSTGSLAGNLLGLVHGLAGVPVEWVEGLVELEVVLQVADDLADAFHGDGTDDGLTDGDLADGDLAVRYPAGA